MPRKIILFELNEVPWRIVDDHVAQSTQSVLARHLPLSRCFTSVAADRGHLSPWVTWPSLHRGVNDELHQIGDLGQDRTEADEKYPPIWVLLRRHGLDVGVCGSLHSFPPPVDMDSYSFYLPDTFAADAAAHPGVLSTFQDYNLRLARESARNVDPGIELGRALKVLMRSRALGLRPATCAAAIKQLAEERRAPWKRTRRRTFQALLAFDVFIKQLTDTRPAFSTFFSNHVASAMHRYWAAAYPEDYDELQLGSDWIERFKHEVPWAMRQADAMLGRLVRFVDNNPEYQLWVASSMGQGPTIAHPLETAVYVSDLGTLMSRFGLPVDRGWQRRPAMLPQVNVVVDEEFRSTFEAGLSRLRLAQSDVPFDARSGGFYSMTFGQPNMHVRPTPVRYDGERHTLASFGLKAVEIEDRSGTTAYHVPEGVLVVYDPADRSAKSSERPTVSALCVAPAILRNFDVKLPAQMLSGDELVTGLSPSG